LHLRISNSVKIKKTNIFAFEDEILDFFFCKIRKFAPALPSRPGGVPLEQVGRLPSLQGDLNLHIQYNKKLGFLNTRNLRLTITTVGVPDGKCESCSNSSLLE
jgi:hypothetical protein